MSELDSFVLSEWEKQRTYRKYVTYSELRQRGTLVERQMEEIWQDCVVFIQVRNFAEM